MLDKKTISYAFIAGIANVLIALTCIIYYSVVPVRYIITFDAGVGVFADGQKLITQKVVGGQMPILPNTPVLEDCRYMYIFDGYDTSVDIANSNRRYVAQYKVVAEIRYSIKYDANGGVYKDNGNKPYIIYQLTYQEKSPTPIPTREGFTFVGYDIEIPDLVTASATYVAQWE